MIADSDHEKHANRFRGDALKKARATRLIHIGLGVEAAVKAAISRGFIIGREVFVGRQPGIVVAYNISSFGQFLGSSHPLVVKTAAGLAKRSLDELVLAE